MGIPFVFPTTKQLPRLILCTVHSIHQVITVWHFISRPIVFGPQSFQFLLHLVAVIRSIIVALMQDQPDLKTWI